MDNVIEKNSKRALLDYNGQSKENAYATITRLLQIDNEGEINKILQKQNEMFGLHSHLHEIWEKHCDRALADAGLNAETYSGVYEQWPKLRKLIGCHFTKEISIEGAALFNGSLIADALSPEQEGEEGIKFKMIARATSEGHLSCGVLAAGGINANGEVTMAARHLSLISPIIELLEEVGSYRATFPPESHISQRVLFPATAQERKGIEDVRLVPFVDKETGDTTYFGTYVAVSDAGVPSSMMMETKDFVTFTMRPICGEAVKGKNLALFPRKIDGKYWMLSRSDGQNNYIMSSDANTPTQGWNKETLLQEPEFSWEMTQIGNCGSPIEINGKITVGGKEFENGGWLVITHGVAAGRVYSIGAILLDKNDPSIILAKTPEPLFEPEGRGGLVPHVTYSCGGLVHKDVLHLPVAEKDEQIVMQKIALQEIWQKMELAGKKRGVHFTDRENGLLRGGCGRS